MNAAQKQNTQTTKRFTGRASLVLAFFALTRRRARSPVPCHLQVLNNDFLNRAGGHAPYADREDQRRTAARSPIATASRSRSARRSTASGSNPPSDSRLPLTASRKLARIVLGLDSQLLIRRITRSMDKEFLYLKRHLSPEQARGRSSR